MTSARIINPLFNTDLEVTDCCVCGVTFAVPSRLIANKREHGTGGLHCPNGHSLGWHKSEAQKLREELAAETRRKDAALARANEADQARVKVERKLKRQTKRINAGVCPCCNRTFQNLARHMASKHKDAET